MSYKFPFGKQLDSCHFLLYKRTNDQVMKTRNPNCFFFISFVWIHDSLFLQFERKETFTMTSYPEAVDHVNDFDEMLHFIIKATASLVSTRAKIIHTIITEKVVFRKMKCTNISWDDFMQSRTILSIVSKRNRRRSTFFYWTSIFTTTFDFQFCHLFSILLVVFFSIWITIQYCQVDKKLSSRYYTHLFNICRLSNGQKMLEMLDGGDIT